MEKRKHFQTCFCVKRSIKISLHYLNLLQKKPQNKPMPLIRLNTTGCFLHCNFLFCTYLAKMNIAFFSHQNKNSKLATPNL